MTGNPHGTTAADIGAATSAEVSSAQSSADYAAFVAGSALSAATEAQSTADSAESVTSFISVTQPVDLDSIESRVNDLDAAVVLKGAWSANAGTFPGAGAARAGWSYIVSVAGTVGGTGFAINDRVIAISDNASTTVYAGNWHKADYTDQVLSVAGKTGAVTLVVADITDAGNSATKNTGTTAGTVATGDDARFTDERVPTAAGLTSKFSTVKASIVDADRVSIFDSAASFAPKHGLWSLVKSTLKTYFDTIYNKYTHPNHTGDVTSVADGAQTIVAGVVTLAKMANLAPSTVIGRVAGSGTGVPVALTPAQLRTIQGLATTDTPTFAGLASTPLDPSSLGVGTGSIRLRPVASGNPNITAEPFGYGAFQIKGGAGTGVNAFAIFEFLDSAGTRIGFIYNEPATGAMKLVNERAGGSFVFGAGGADRMTILPSGGIHVTNATAVDPGAACLKADQRIEAGTYLASGITTVASLISAASGARHRIWVSDSTLPAIGNFGATVIGGGSNTVEVKSNGTNWVIC
ncbi:MAG: hypothetical protein ABIR91_03680 [Candidatus Saccharimonadales bacterium]